MWNLTMVLVFFVGCFLTWTSSNTSSVEVVVVTEPPPAVVPVYQTTRTSTNIAIGDLVVTRPVGKRTYTRRGVEVSDKDLLCLYKNAFYEAGISSHDDRVAVIQVTFNRLLHERRWNRAKSLCDIVYWKSAFSWTLIPKSKRAPMRGPLWIASKQAVHAYLDGYEIPEVADSIFYHATWMKRKPTWADDRYKVAVVGSHVHYRNDRKL